MQNAFSESGFEKKMMFLFSRVFVVTSIYINVSQLNFPNELLPTLIYYRT